MTTFADMLARFQGFNVIEEAGKIVEKHEVEIVELNKEQLLEGRNAAGELLTPGYSEDSYFKTPEKAHNYANWKQQKFPNPNRPFDTPNLIVVGLFHKGIYIRIQGDKITFGNNTKDAAAIMAKYPNILGLNESGVAKLRAIVHPELINRLKEHTGTR